MSGLITHRFRLYVAGDTFNSRQALNNLTDICHKYLSDRYQIEVKDVYEHPELAQASGVFLTPTLIRLQPLPEQSIVGTLSQFEPLFQLLGLHERAP